LLSEDKVFKYLDSKLVRELEKIEPTGVGNPAPVFATEKVNVIDVRTVGAERKHLKITLEKNDKIFSAIAFGMGEFYEYLLKNKLLLD